MVQMSAEMAVTLGGIILAVWYLYWYNVQHSTTARIVKDSFSTWRWKTNNATRAIGSTIRGISRTTATALGLFGGAVMLLASGDPYAWVNIVTAGALTANLAGLADLTFTQIGIGAAVTFAVFALANIFLLD